MSISSSPYVITLDDISYLRMINAASVFKCENENNKEYYLKFDRRTKDPITWRDDSKDYHYWSPDGKNFYEIKRVTSFTSRDEQQIFHTEYVFNRHKNDVWNEFSMRFYKGYAQYSDGKDNKHKYTELNTDEANQILEVFKDNISNIIKLPPKPPSQGITLSDIKLFEDFGAVDVFKCKDDGEYYLKFDRKTNDPNVWDNGGKDYHFWSPDGKEFYDILRVSAVPDCDDQKIPHVWYSGWRHKNDAWYLFKMRCYKDYAKYTDTKGNEKKYTMLSTDEENKILKVFKDNIPNIIKLPGKPPAKPYKFIEQLEKPKTSLFNNSETSFSDDID